MKKEYTAQEALIFASAVLKDIVENADWEVGSRLEKIKNKKKQRSKIVTLKKS